MAEVAGFVEDAGSLLDEEAGFLLEDDSGLLLAEDAGFVVFGFLDEAVVETAELAGVEFWEIVEDREDEELFFFSSSLSLLSGRSTADM